MRNFYFLSILFLSFSIYLNAQEKTENYLPNAEFDTWDTGSLTGWTLENNSSNESSYAQETTNTHSNLSTNSVLYTATVNNKGYFTPSNSITINEPGRYFFGFWIKATVANTTIKAGYKIGTSGSFTYSMATIPFNDTDWKYMIIFYDAVEGDVIKPRFSPTGESSFYIDDVSLSQGNPNSSAESSIHRGNGLNLNSTTAFVDYTNYFTHQGYSGGNYGALSLEDNIDNVHSGLHSLKYVTTSDASNTKRGVLVFKDNDSFGIRYLHPTTTTAREYQGSVWVKSPNATSVKFNLKIGTSNNFSDTAIPANQWTKIYSPVVDATSLAADSKIYPILQFAEPSTTYYVDDYYLNWASLGTLSTQTFDISSINIYPNPTDNTLNVKSNIDLIEIQINNLLGQKIIRKTDNFETINVSNLSKGMYIITMKTINGQSKSKRFLKK